jgi:two-component system sensor histidine kinase PilS (NtrC family)
LTPNGRDFSDSQAGSRPQGQDPAGRLLVWRLFLAGFLTLICTVSYLVIPEKLVLPGLISSLGLMFTALAASWAAVVAGLPARILLAAQLAMDALVVALLVHFSGGPYSAFPLIYCIPIIMGAYYLGRRGAMALAGVAAVATGGGHFGLALGWLIAGSNSGQDYLQGWPVMVSATHMGIFLVVGIISGDLAERLAKRQRLQLRNVLQIRQARSEVRNILDNIRSGLLTIDKHGVITRVNPSCCRILEMSPSDLVGRPVDQVMLGGLEELANIILPVARGSEPVNRGEIKVKRLGREKPLGLNVNHMTTSRGKTVGAIAIFTDLTREKEMTARIREADRLAAIGELAASIAHEIRNPLASIRGSVEMLQDELELEGYQEQLFELVLKESSRVNTIINDFLAYSRMRPASLERFRGADFMEEFRLQIQQHIAAKGGGVSLRCEVNPGNLEVVADSGQLTQMTLNLAINACEAMNYRGDLRISLNQLEGGGTLELVVTDSGPGIEDEIREHLFSPFKTTKERGTGLGLSTVARIASSHGGVARAEDAPGGGSTFRVRWPRKNDPDIPFNDLKYTQEEAPANPAGKPAPSLEELLV